MTGKNKNIEKYKSEVLKNIYFINSNNIYVKNHNRVKKIEKDKVKCQDAFLCFLRKNLSPDNYNRAFKYINDLSQKSNNITGIWNQIFYFSGLEDKKLFQDRS